MVLRILKLQILNCYYFLLNVLAFFFFFDKGYWQFLIYFDSQMKIVLEKIKTNSNFSEKKSVFVDSGFVETCDEHFTIWENGYLFLAQLGF